MPPNAIIIFIMYFYTYLLLFVLFIILIIYCYGNLLNLYLLCISTVCIGIVLIHILFIFTELDLNSPLFHTCNIKFIEDKSYFEGRACYIGKIKSTCIE